MGTMVSGAAFTFVQRRTRGGRLTREHDQVCDSHARWIFNLDPAMPIGDYSKEHGR